mmetsp:Transcript_40332/g.89563  ORF Transcript_40332/g.89563 Transcript_40332/m.89563 type:complete len:200 (+) Transcript_40332:365-964(+)
MWLLQMCIMQCQTCHAGLSTCMASLACDGIRVMHKVQGNFIRHELPSFLPLLPHMQGGCCRRCSPSGPSLLEPLVQVETCQGPSCGGHSIADLLGLRTPVHSQGREPSTDRPDGGGGLELVLAGGGALVVAVVGAGANGEAGVARHDVGDPSGILVQELCAVLWRKKQSRSNASSYNHVQLVYKIVCQLGSHGCRLRAL